MSDSNEKISKALDVDFDPSAPKEITVSKKDIEKIKKEKREVMLSGDFEKAKFFYVHACHLLSKVF